MTAARVTTAIRAANAEGRAAIIAYITGGFPTVEQFRSVLGAIATAADLVEVGIPFTDPMADGATIQRASHEALRQGTTTSLLFDTIGSAPRTCPVLFMTYTNPLLARGIERFGDRCVDADISGVIVPDMPPEEGHAVLTAMDARDLAMVQLVSPVTPAHRLPVITSASRGFLYAVTATGVTGGQAPRDTLTTYLDEVAATTDLPVCAGFGIRTEEDAAKLAPHAAGLIVGSALIEDIEHGRDPAERIRSLKKAARQS